MLTDAQKRYLIVKNAYLLAVFGSHYLTGTDGAIPGGKGMDSFRNLNLKEELNIDDVAVHAAENGYGVCSGRYERVEFGKEIKKNSSDYKEELPKYLDDLKTEPKLDDHFSSFRATALYPRLSYKKILLAEDCRNKRHFDCESFVTWVLVYALNKDKGVWRKGVDWFQAGGNGRLTVYKKNGSSFKNEKGKVIKKSDILHGDILIRKEASTREHIAFAYEKGAGVVEASGRTRGVIVSEFKASKWTELARIKKL